MCKNIVITGEGIVSAIGIGKHAVLESLRDKRSGIAAMNHLSSIHSDLPVGEVKMSNDEMRRCLGIDKVMEYSRTALMGITAIKEAIGDASLGETEKSLRIVLVSGTTVGGMDITEKHFMEMQKTDDHLGCLEYHDCGKTTELMAEYFGVFSEFTTISTACSSAANAIMLGARLLESGQADIVVAGGSEALSKFHLNGFNTLMILDHKQCRPFDNTRSGLNLGEGAAFLVMETEESAKKRETAIHAYLTGYCNACDAFHQTATSPDGKGACLAMEGALHEAGLSPKDIQYINAHGTGTPDNDKSESTAINRVFGNDIPPVSSTKSFTGHTTSASGSIESIFCIMALQHHFIPANLGWSEKMPDGITPSRGEDHHHMENVMCNAFGFGGNVSSLIFSSRPKEKVPSKTLPHSCSIKVLSKVEINDETQLPEIRDYVNPLETRRMGKLMKSSLLASLKALHEADIEVPDAIITGTAFGCLENSEKFLIDMCENGEETLKPTLFMQSTHNTISSNIAIKTKCHGYNITYTQNEKSLEWALKDARQLIRDGKAKYVLVGCHDESTPMYRNLMKRLGKAIPASINSVAMVLACGD